MVSNILFTRFPLESAYGGAEVQTIALAHGFRSAGHTVSFAGSCATLLELFHKDAFEIHQLAIGPPPVTKWDAISFWWRKNRMQTYLINALSRRNLTHIFMLSLSEKLLLTPWAIEQGIQVVWMEHDRMGRWLTHNPWLSQLKELSAHVSTVTVSDLSRDLYVQLGFSGEHVVSIPNGIDIHTFVPADEVHTLPDRSALHIGCIARLTKDKGVDILVDAVTGMQNVELTIIGRGREQSAIQKK